MRRLARRLHRYLLLIVGVQMLLWSVSGLYMVWFDIHYIHGDHFIKSSPALLSLSTVNVGFDEVVARYPTVVRQTSHRHRNVQVKSVV